MNTTAARRMFLWGFIGFLSLTALVAVVSLIGGDFGEMQWKILGTTFTLSSASICAMACAAYIEKRGQKAIGTLGILSSAIAAAMTIFGMWAETGSDNYWKFTVALIVVSIAFAHGLLLSIPSLDAAYKWTQKVAILLISILVLQAFYLIFINQNHDDFRWIAINSIFVVLMTFVIPICAKLKSGPAKPEQLVLNKVSDGVYTDNSGRKFKVIAIENEPQS